MTRLNDDTLRRAGRENRASRGGFTLVEMMTVVAILGILLMTLGFAFRGWVAKGKADAQLKQMHVDMLEARGRAITHGRYAWFVVTGANSWATYEDTSPKPDGDMTLTTTSDRRLAAGTASWPITANLGDGTATTITFNRDGIASPSGVIRLGSGLNTKADAIHIGPTRLKVGKYNSVTGQVDEQ